MTSSSSSSYQCSFCSNRRRYLHTCDCYLHHNYCEDCLSNHPLCIAVKSSFQKQKQNTSGTKQDPIDIDMYTNEPNEESKEEPEIEEALQIKCCICLDDILADGSSITLSCFHTLHKLCIKDWIVISRSCPYCRKRLSLRHKRAILVS